MKLRTDCIPCNINAALKAIRELTTEENAMRELVVEIMEIPALRGLDWSYNRLTTSRTGVQEDHGRLR